MACKVSISCYNDLARCYNALLYCLNVLTEVDSELLSSDKIVLLQSHYDGLVSRCNGSNHSTIL
jgi:hypothetical protein